jgi:hypothetical protein
MSQAESSDWLKVQRHILAELQMDHQDRLRASGILTSEVVKAKIEADDEFISLKAAVYASSKSAPSLFLMRLGLTKATGQSRIDNVIVADTFGGDLAPRPGFSRQQADLVGGMVLQLSRLRESGLLPDLALMCTEIINPVN